MTSRPFEARYHSTCAACEEHIRPGEDVRYEDDQLVHDACTEKPEPRTRPVCPKCWLVTPCECDS